MYKLLFHDSGFQELQWVSPKQLSHLMVRLCMSVLLMEMWQYLIP